MPTDRILTCRYDMTTDWSAELGHPIEDLTAEDDLTPLPRWTPGAQTIADDGLVAEERVLHPALTWYPDACFQRRRPSVFTNVIVRPRVGDRGPCPETFAVLAGGITTVAPRARAVS